jgi:SRSO17 transposase
VATEAASLPIAYQLYLPEVWSSDRRRRQTDVREELGFLTKQILWQNLLKTQHF